MASGPEMGGPGMGALGGPPLQHNYKRAVQRSAPREFVVEVLPPTKFGSGFCYGMRICPITGDVRDDTSSGKSGNSHTEYEVWRRWEDCLYLQEILEEEYGMMARNKRHRLAAGKGVKKNGVYIQSDQAASFESLPPGPEANSVAKDVHEIIPKLTKKGTLFRPSQSTVDQRGKEFQAMIETLLSDDVPTLIKELRELRTVRDFFAYWRRDKDHERKARRPSTSAGGRDSVTSSAFSMYFSASNLSLQMPNSYADLPPSPALPSAISVASSHSSKSAKGKSPAYARSDSSASSSSLSRFPNPPAGPAAQATPMSFSVSARGSLYVDTPERVGGYTSEPDDRPRTAPPRSQTGSYRRSLNRPFSSQTSVDGVEMPIMFTPDDHSWSDGLSSDHGMGLQALPEDQELASDIRHLSIGNSPQDAPPPVRRSHNNSCPGRANRNCVIFMTTPPDRPEIPQRAASQVLHPDVESLNVQDSQPDSRSPELSHSASVLADSSRNSTASFSRFSAETSRRSSWRTSVASETSVASDITSGAPKDSDFDPQRNSILSSFSMQSSMSSIAERWIPYSSPQPSHASRASVATINSLISNSSVDAVLPRRMSPPPNGTALRSLSNHSRRSVDTRSNGNVAEDVWYEQRDDCIDAYFYDPSLRSTPASSVLPDDHQYGGREVLPLRFDKHMSTPDRFPKPFQDRPPGQFHLPWSPPASPPRMTSPSGSDTYTIKAMLRESIVLLRASYGTSYPEVRERLRDKFAKQEEVPLSNPFVIGYLPQSAIPQTPSTRGRPRSSSLSSERSLTSLRYIYSEEEWHTAVAGCAGKLTIRIFDTKS
ncbi:hypothetical protein BKA93DRAFT_798032 [Sparassis latifolia]